MPVSQKYNQSQLSQTQTYLGLSPTCSDSTSPSITSSSDDGQSCFLLVGDVIRLDSKEIRIRHPEGWWAELSLVHPNVIKAISLLDGTHTLNSILELLNAKLHQSFIGLFKSLLQVGLVSGSTPPTAQIAVVGDGPLAASLIESLCGLAKTIYTTARRLPQSISQPTTASIGRITQPTHRPFRTSVKSIEHWIELNDELDLVIVASQTVEPDRGIVEYLNSRELTHLIVRAHGDLAVIGPLVDGISGSCLRCQDLMLTDGDPNWPTCLQALTQIQAAPSLNAIRLATNASTLRIEWYLQTHSSDLFSTTVQMSAYSPGVERRVWQTHANCACQLSRHTEGDSELLVA